VDTNTPNVDDQDIPQLRFLRVLVSVLAGVMIVGLLVLIVLIVIRFREDPVSTVFPDLPAAITLPEGVEVQAVTAGKGWYMIVTETGRALVYSPDGTEVSDTQLVLPD
jgi:hypothetical protein